MNKEKILKFINQLENTIIQLKLELEFQTIDKKDKIKKSKKRKYQNKKTDLEMPIKNFLNERFFGDWKKDTEVFQKLKEKILISRTLRRSSITNVLRRLFDKGLLDRKETIEGKKTILVYREKKVKK